MHVLFTPQDRRPTRQFLLYLQHLKKTYNKLPRVSLLTKYCIMATLLWIYNKAELFLTSQGPAQVFVILLCSGKCKVGSHIQHIQILFGNIDDYLASLRSANENNFYPQVFVCYFFITDVILSGSDFEYLLFICG